MGGVAFATLGLLELLVRYLIPPSYIPSVLEYIRITFLFLLLVGVMAAIAGLHALQRERYGLVGTLASLTAFAGVATIFVVGLADVLTGQRYSGGVGFTLVVGALVATVGAVALGTVTIVAGVLPRWCGALIILGSPPSVVFLLGPLVGVDWALGVVWALVGYVLLKEAEA